MKQVYADLHVFLSKLNVEDMVSTLRPLGFHTIGFTLQERMGGEEAVTCIETVRKSGLDFVIRIDVKPYGRKRFLSEVVKARRGFDLVTAACGTKQDVRVAVRSGVDVVFIERSGRIGLNAADFRLIADSKKVYEVNLRPIIAKEGLDRAHILSDVAKELCLASRFKVPIILSSGAMDRYGLRAPMDMAYVLTMAGLGLGEALKAVSKNPEALVEAVRLRKQPGYVTAGVRVVGREGVETEAP